MTQAASENRTSWRPVHVEIEGFRGIHTKLAYEISPQLTLLIGANAAGKSSCLNAIEWCLFGDIVSGKGKSGLVERSDWDAKHRKAERLSVRVAFDNGEERCVLIRTGKGTMGSAGPLRIEFERQDELADKAAQDWLEAQLVPTWATWRHAFCQHQEDARTRVLDSRDRSDQIAGMLGLQGVRQTRNTMDEAYKEAQRSVARVEDRLATLEEDMARPGDGPQVQAKRFAERLEERGHASAHRNDTWFLDHFETHLKTLPETMLVPLGEGDELPAITAEDPETALQLADAWLVRSQDHAARIQEALTRASKDHSSIADELEVLGPSQLALRKASKGLDDLNRELGTVDALEQDLENQTKRIEDLDQQRKDCNALISLLQDSSDHLEKAPNPEECPVCEQTREGLPQRLQERLESMHSAEIQGLKQQIEAATKRAEELGAHLVRLRSAEETLKTAKTRSSNLIKKLADLLELPPEDPAQVASAARKAQEDLGRSIQDLEGRSSDANSHCRTMETLRSDLDLYLHWKSSDKSRSIAETPLQETPAWSRVDAALDEIGCLAADLAALSRMAKQLEAELSDERIREVSDRLGGHYARITGRQQDQAVRVQKKETAKGLKYMLVDEEGNNVTPILNQASLNALSFAFLLAHVQHRLTEGEPQWLILDDIDQSLDEQHQKGLATALGDMAHKIPVMVASLDSPLATAIRARDDIQKNVYEVHREGQQTHLEPAQ